MAHKNDAIFYCFFFGVNFVTLLLLVSAASRHTFDACMYSSVLQCQNLLQGILAVVLSCKLSRTGSFPQRSSPANHTFDASMYSNGLQCRKLVTGHHRHFRHRSGRSRMEPVLLEAERCKCRGGGGASEEGFFVRVASEPEILLEMGNDSKVN
jgi:hypothetical protein